MRRVREWRRRRLWAVVLTLAVGLTAGGVAAASMQGGKHGIKKKTVITVVEVIVDEAFVDADPPATSEDDISPGDAFFFHGELWNRAQTRKVGSNQGYCTFLFDGLGHCEATLFLPGGTVQAEGGVDFGPDAPSTFSVAVTGGTKRYENVVGELKGTQVEEGTRFRLELIPSFQRP